MEDTKENYITGWVRVYRSLSKKGWYKKSDYVHLWVHLIIKATHKNVEFMFNGQNIKLKSGQFITGRKKLSEETGINESKIERILNFFEKNEQQIEQQKSNKNRLISILNWKDYQIIEQQNEQQLNNKRTTTEQQMNTYNNYKNEENDNNDKKFNFRKSFIDLGVEDSYLDDWLKVRKTKKASNTETAFKKIKNKIEVSTLTANDCIRIAAENSWAGFDINWVKDEKINTENNSKDQEYEESW